MTEHTVIPCIIAGGSGTRLWPVSRQTMPKPFMRLKDGQTLLQKTLLRLHEISSTKTTLAVINNEMMFRALADHQALGRPDHDLQLLLEPFGRNTAAAVLMCALQAQTHWGEDAIILVSPADQLIEDTGEFHTATQQAIELAAQGYLTTFGLRPTHPETGYGYIKAGNPLGDLGAHVEEFIEKPDLIRATEFVKSGRYLWNSGIFCMQAKTVIQQAEAIRPDLFSAILSCWRGASQEQNARYHATSLPADLFSDIQDVSFDIAILEHSDRVAVVPCQLGWRDIGSWASLSELTDADAEGNRLIGESILHDVHGCYIDSPDRLTAAIGVDNLVIIDTPDALLVADKTRTQDVRILANKLKEAGHPAYMGHRTMVRPWGRYTVLAENPSYKIKQLVVNPKASLSLQSHFHRSEHWVVVSGTAEVSNGDRKFLLHTNESTFIREGEKHRLSNPGQVDLIIIEVQSGQYLGEDDIVRYDDVYGRNERSGDVACAPR